MGLEDLIQLPDIHQRPRFDADRGLLIGSRCADCSASSWPSRALCHRCGSPAIATVEFGPLATLTTSTTVWVARPGVETPYTLGQAVFADGPLVTAQVRGMPEQATLPISVRLFVRGDGSQPPFWFEPEGS